MLAPFDLMTDPSPGLGLHDLTSWPQLTFHQTPSVRSFDDTGMRISSIKPYIGAKQLAISTEGENERQSFRFPLSKPLSYNQISVMFCGQCSKQYDSTVNIPRLLVICGHSLCETCCYRLHFNHRVQCPQCKANTYIESIPLLPKNLALITHSSNAEMCTKHSKKYEAYCEKENVLICIECILQDGHRNHEMDSIKNSYEKHKQRWGQKIDKIQVLSQKQETSLKQALTIKEEFQQTLEATQENIHKFFNLIRESISREEENALSKIHDTFTQGDQKYAEKIQKLNESVQQTASILQRTSGYEAFSQVEFLRSHHDRQAMYASASQQTEEIPKPPLLSFNKKTTVEALNKAFQGLAAETKHEKKVSSININTYGAMHTHAKKPSDQQITSIKAVRKTPVTISATPVAANSNRKKVSTKKDTMPIVVQTPNHHHSPALVSKTGSSQRDPQSQQRDLPSNKKQNRQPTVTSELNCKQLAHQIRGDISAVDARQSLCHSFMSNMTSFFTERRNIYVMGGFNQEANNVIRLNMTNGSWQQVCQLNCNRSKFGLSAVEGQLMVFGGKKGKERVSDSQVYDITSGKWSKAKNMGKNRSGFAVAAINEVLYFIGGNDGDDILSSVDAFNTKTGEWRRKEPMHQARDQLAIAIGKNNKIYAIGGFGGKYNQPLRSAEVYDPITDKWHCLPEMNDPRRALAAAVLADGVYAIGGFDGNVYMKSVQKFEEDQTGWCYVGEMKQARCTHTAVSIHQTQQIFVLGGFDYVPLDSVQRYNVISNEWQQACHMPTPRFMHASILMKQE